MVWITAAARLQAGSLCANRTLRGGRVSKTIQPLATMGRRGRGGEVRVDFKHAGTPISYSK